MEFDRIPSLEFVKELIRPSIEKHYDVFLRKYVDLVHDDEYDEIDTDDFEKEMTKFLKKYPMCDYRFNRETWEAAGGVGYLVFMEIARERGDDMRYYKCPEANEYCRNFMEDNYETFMNIWRQNIQRDFNGDLDLDAIEKNLGRALSPNLKEMFSLYRDKHWHGVWVSFLVPFLEKVKECGDISRFCYELDREDNYNAETISDGVAYENYIQELLEHAGFDVETTPRTGDQGVDLIAKKNYLSIAIQCKYWQSHVGNSAVQEVFAGSKYYGTTYRAVVTNAGYTSSAKDLAKHLHVLLLTDDDLIETIDYLFEID